MIYEMRTYDLKPRSVPELEKRWAEMLDKRVQLSPLAAFWHGEVGPLNQIIHVWPYKDMNERARIRAEAIKMGIWPPKGSDFIVRMQSEIFIPFASSPELKPAKMGPYYEIRRYTFPAGELGKIQKCWDAALPERQKLSPIVALWYADLGAVNTFIHIWAYKTLNEREETRKKALETGLWPPSVYDAKQGGKGYELLAQENKIVMPSAFSPLQ
jgi:hypothetical protein